VVVLAAAAAGLVAVLLADRGDAPPVGPARLVVHEQTAQRQPDATYVEGAVSFLRVSSTSGPPVRFRARSGYKRVGEGFERRPIHFDRTLQPGRYVVSSYVRPCGGNCGVLDPPTDRCATEVVLEPGVRVDATVVSMPTRPCRIEIDRH
jgi:hypothetical protein